MTKKQQTLLKKFEERVNVYFYLYKENITDFEKTLNDLHEIRHDFEKMVQQMYLYDLLSDADYEGIYGKAYEIHQKAFEQMLEIKHSQPV